jgi:hypothetical protein
MVDLLSFILVVVGGIMVYGAKYILKFIKVNHSDSEFRAFKLIGTTIAVIGILRVIEVI